MTMDGDDWRQDPQWLELPIDKRENALVRMDVVKRFKALKRRSALDADQYAAELGLARSRFYDLCKLWDRTGSPVSLAPFGDPVTRTRPAVRKDRSEEIVQKVHSALSATPDRTPKAIIKAVTKSWGDKTKPPARETLRRFILRAIESEDADEGQILKREGSEVARKFGDVIVVDHSIVDIFADDDGTPTRPTLTCAIDLFTGAPVGHAVAFTRPTPDMVVAALKDAVRRSAEFGGGATWPRILMNTSYAPEWTKLIKRMTTLGLVLNGRRAPDLPFGAPTARLVGGKLGRLRLLARAGHEEAGTTAGFRQELDPVLTVEQARAVIVTNLATVLLERLGAHGGQPLRFDFLETGSD